MVLTREQKHKAFLEAKATLALGKKWQRLVPGERRPNFERAAANTLRKALGHKTAEHRHNLHISNNLMHEHTPSPARIIERTLKNGVIDSDVLHSFRDDYRTVAPSKPRRAPAYLHHDDPEPEVWLMHDADIDYVSHYNVNTGEYKAHEHQWIGHHVAHRPEPGSTVKTESEHTTIV